MRYRGHPVEQHTHVKRDPFIGVLNLPTLIKTYLIEPEPEVQANSPYPYLLNPTAELQALHFAKWSVVQEDGYWVYQMKDPVSEQSVSARELSQRWQQLVGTEVDSQAYADLPNSLRRTPLKWYQDKKSPRGLPIINLLSFGC